MVTVTDEAVVVAAVSARAATGDARKARKVVLQVALSQDSVVALAVAVVPAVMRVRRGSRCATAHLPGSRGMIEILGSLLGWR
jgi:hypothetical protein